MKIQFKSKLGGPCGENRRTFVDDIVVNTRAKAPLIGVRFWSEVHPVVKNEIVQDVMETWDFEGIQNPEEKILKIAHARYKGWRGDLSATYKAFDSYEDRMRHEPAELNIVEWHYLCHYFGTKTFRNASTQNSGNRGRVASNHTGGSKPYSQWSWKKRDPQTGAEPRQLELWKITHSRDGKWRDEVAETIYDCTVRKLAELANLEEGDEGTSSTPRDEQEDNIFQETYKERTHVKSSVSRGYGYMATQRSSRVFRERLFQEKLDKVEARECQLEEILKNHEADKAREKEEMEKKMEMKMQEQFAMMIAPYKYLLPCSENTHASNNSTGLVEPRVNEVGTAAITLAQSQDTTNMTPSETINNSSNEAIHTRQEEDIPATPVVQDQKHPPSTAVTKDKEIVPPTNSHASARITKTLFGDKSDNRATPSAGPPRYISSNTMQSQSKTRSGRKRTQETGMETEALETIKESRSANKNPLPNKKHKPSSKPQLQK